MNKLFSACEEFYKLALATHGELNVSEWAAGRDYREEPKSQFHELKTNLRYWENQLEIWENVSPENDSEMEMRTKELRMIKSNIEEIQQAMLAL